MKQRTSSVNPGKELRSIQRSVGRHWVGDGFPVRTLLAYPNLGPVITPFLLLDYAGPMDFPPTNERLGVGEHPHRGFETVTIVYAGEVEHRDSSGGGGRIGPGDVQWMTAASGIVHEEFHGRAFARRGGRFEMVQLWACRPRTSGRRRATKRSPRPRSPPSSSPRARGACARSPASSPARAGRPGPSRR
jgi:redox-sensitive bicupin YhaK (pirin superfamily)